MSFLYLRSSKQHASILKTVSQNPSQVVAAGIFQLNTDVAAFSHLADTIDNSNYSPQLRDKLDNISQDIMLLVKDTLDKLFDYFGWPFDQTTNVSLNRDQKVEGHKLAKDFQAVLENFRKALQRASGPSVSQSQTPSETVASGIVQINHSVLDYHSLVDAIGMSKETPEHRKKLQEMKHHIVALVLDTSAKLKNLGELEQGSRVVNASSTQKSKNRVTKLKKVFKRLWKSENPAPGVSEGKNSEAATLANDFQVAVQEFQKAQLLASRLSSSNDTSSILTEGAEFDIMEVQPFLLKQKCLTEGAEFDIMEVQPFLLKQKWQESDLSEMKFSEPAFEEWVPRFKEVDDQVEQVYVMVDTLLDVAYLADEQAINIDDVGATIEASHVTSRAKYQFFVPSTSIRSCSSWCWWLLAVFATVMIIFVLILLL